MRVSFAFYTTFLLVAFCPAIVSASTYEPTHLPYSDVAPSSLEALAISVLTEQGVVQGNPDGTFRAGSALNRAEFLKIVMGLLPPDQEATVHMPCFVDVPADAWFALPVCRAKAAGIVRGNALLGVPEEEWLFAPERPVQAEEATKILVELYGLPVSPQEHEQWFEPYMRAAAERNVIQSGLFVGKQLLRGEMARLTARFVADRKGELSLFLAAEQSSEERQEGAQILREEKSEGGEELFSGTVETVEINGTLYTIFPMGSDDAPLSSDHFWNSCVRGKSLFRADGKPLDCGRFRGFFSSTWDHPDIVQLSFKWNPVNTYLSLPRGFLTKKEAQEMLSQKKIPESAPLAVLSSQLVRKGTLSPVLARITAKQEYSDEYKDQPWNEKKEQVPRDNHLSSVRIELGDKPSALNALLVYSGEELLGEAAKVAGADRTYQLDLTSGEYVRVPYGEEITVSVRAKIPQHERSGSQGNDGEYLAVSRLMLGGTKPWHILSTKYDMGYVVQSKEAFPLYQIAHSTIDGIEAIDTGQSTFGSDRVLGAFRVHGTVADVQDAKLHVLEFKFDLEGKDLPEVSSVYLSSNNTEEKISCDVVAQKRIDCDDIVEIIGKLEGGERTFTIYGRVIPTRDSLPFRLVIGDRGAPRREQPGAVSWTNGNTIFEWISIPLPVQGPEILPKF